MKLDSNEEKDIVITSDKLEVENCVGVQNMTSNYVQMSLQDFSDDNKGYILEKYDVFTFGGAKTIYLKAKTPAMVHLQGGE